MNFPKVTATVSATVFAFTLLLAPTVFAQTAVTKTLPQPTPFRSTQNQTVTTKQQPTSTPAIRTTPVSSPQTQTQTRILEQLKTNQPWVEWFTWWWKIDLVVGLLWFLVWVFVGWQWTNFQFWGFGWPWPWWFWIPLFWFIPWLIIGWFWWPFWWIWWFWIWFWWPWVFWSIWWIILFKEAIIWHFRRRKSVQTD